MDLEPVAEVPDVVQRAARRGAHERVDVRAEVDSASVRCEPMKPSAPVTSTVRSLVEVAEVSPQPRERLLVQTESFLFA